MKKRVFDTPRYSVSRIKVFTKRAAYNREYMRRKRANELPQPQTARP